MFQTNLVCDVIVQRLPVSIGGLKQLRVLDLEENKLDLLPAEIGRLSFSIKTTVVVA